MRIGVISDTHNYLDPGVLKLFAGVDHILHGGDIGKPAILRALEEIAPVTAVAGNTDDPLFRYPLFALGELGEWRFLLHHIVNPALISGELRQKMESAKPHAVIFGHTHKVHIGKARDVLFFNPGSAGKSRFGLPRTVGIITQTAHGLQAEAIPLPGQNHEH